MKPLRRLALIPILAIAAGGTACLVHTVDRGTDPLVIRALLSLTRGRESFDGIAAVAIDRRTSLSLNQRAPLPRDEQATVVRQLTRAGASVIAYDLTLNGVSEPGPDDAIVRALTSARAAVVAADRYSASGVPELLAGTVPFFRTRVRPGDILRHGPSGTSWLNFPRGTGRLASFPQAVAAVARQRPALGVPRGALIDYRGPPGTLHALSFSDVLRGHFNPAAVRGRIVVVGDTLPESQDRHTVPYGSQMTGLELEANVISTALDGFRLRRSGEALGILLGGALGLAILMLEWVRARIVGRPSRLPRPNFVPVFGAALLLTWSAATTLAFVQGRFWDWPAGAAAIAIACALTRWQLVGERRRLFANGDDRLVVEAMGAHRRRDAARRINGYWIEARIGVGGMGTVYRATDVELQRPVAIKLIATRFAGQRDYQRRFLEEARAAARVNSPHVVPVHQLGRSRDQLYIVTTYIRGHDLSDELKAVGYLEINRAILLTHGLAAALDKVHLAGVIHCDVKPSNVLIADDDPDHAYLTDFGIARAARLAHSTSWSGTPAYGAPELGGGGTVGPAADIYSLGATFFHAVTGMPPFTADDSATLRRLHATAPRPQMSRHNPGVAQPLDAVVGRAMAINPDDRYPSALEFAEALDHVTREQIVAPGVAPTRRPTASDHETTELA